MITIKSTIWQGFASTLPRGHGIARKPIELFVPFMWYSEYRKLIAR